MSITWTEIYQLQGSAPRLNDSKIENKKITCGDKYESHLTS